MATQDDYLLRSLLDSVDSDNEQVSAFLLQLQEDTFEWNPDITEVEKTEAENVGLQGVITIKAPQELIADIRFAVDGALEDFDGVTVV